LKKPIKRIVVLEDENATLELMESILTEDGYDVIPFNHHEPLEYLIDFDPQLMLLDIRLANGYGHLLCKDLKANPLTAKIPVILVSGSNNLDIIAKDAQADAYLSKPFGVNDLLQVVKAFD